MSGWLSQLTTATAQAAQKVKTATTVRLNALSRIIKNNVLTAQASSYATLGLGLLAILLLVLIIKPGHYFKREPDAHDGLKKNEQHLKKMSNRLKKLK